MEKKALSVAALAMLCGIGLLHLYMRAFEARVSGGAKHSVLVVTRDARAGETLTRAILGTRELPEAYVESRHIDARELDKVLAAKLEVEAHANEALLWSDVAGMTARATSLASLVHQGLRAYALRANDGGFSGLLRPGDRVDILSVTGSTREDEGARAQTLLENVLVLAVGDETTTRDEAAQEKRSAMQATRITVLVSNEQGQALALAERNSALRLLVRNPTDIVVSTEGAITTSERAIQ